MIPCYVCGEDIASGWFAGLTPAPDSQKTGLCKKHDNQENREIAFNHWQNTNSGAIARDMELKKAEHTKNKGLIMLHIAFMDGGSLALACKNFGIVENTMLEITTSTGEKKFYPLQHIRSYSVLDEAL